MKFKKYYNLLLEDYDKDVVFISNLFKELGNTQRYEGPEEMFHRNVNPGVQYSSIFQWLAEHTGDLIHRASYPPKGTLLGGPITSGFDAVQEKVEKIFRTATDFKNYYNTTRENPFLKSLENDYFSISKREEMDLTFDEYKEQFINAGKKYSESYRLLTYYTELQRLSRLSAILLGKLDI